MRMDHLTIKQTRVLRSLRNLRKRGKAHGYETAARVAKQCIADAGPYTVRKYDRDSVRHALTSLERKGLVRFNYVETTDVDGKYPGLYYGYCITPEGCRRIGRAR